MEWEVHVVHDTPNSCVRRMRVPGGWLYQVEYTATIEPTASGSAPTYVYGWHPPVFVADGSK